MLCYSLTITKYMKSGSLEINVTIDSRVETLFLTADHFKQQFRQFIALHELSPQQSFYCKNLIQAALISHFLGPPQQNADNLQASTISRSAPESPSFSEVKHDQFRHTVLKKENYNLFHNVCLLQQNEIAFTNQEPRHLNTALIKPELNQQSKHEANAQLQSSLFATVSKQKRGHPQIGQQLKTKNKQFADESKETINGKMVKQSRISPQLISDRLFHTATESLKNKNKPDVDRREFQDYLEVDKYLINQKLKRTTKQFYDRLHSNRTASSRSKTKAKGKSHEQLDSPISPSHNQAKNVSLSKAYKGSTWKSRSHCEMQKIILNQQKRQRVQKDRERAIRRQIGLRNASPKQALSGKHISRKCEKCTAVPSQKKLITKAELPPNKLEYKDRPYIGNLLKECYDEFLQDMI